jgi:heterodisulfide reductase subunit B
MATVERMGLKTMTSPCSNCFARLKAAEHAAAHDEPALRTAQARAERPYGGGVRIEHVLDTLVDRTDLSAVRAKVEKPLSGLKVACYYGCLITRPSRVTGAAHPEYPMKMDYLLRALGAETVDWSYKTECCGGALGITQPQAARRMSGRVLRNAQECGAEAVVTMCPMCHLNLDARQPEMGLDRGIPILHATQLMMLAFGHGDAAAQLGKNVVDPRPLLDGKGVTGSTLSH